MHSMRYTGPAMQVLEQTISQRLRRRPGWLDGQLSNASGEAYQQSVHGDNPLGSGFSYCVHPRRQPPRAVTHQKAWLSSGFGIAFAAGLAWLAWLASGRYMYLCKLYAR